MNISKRFLTGTYTVLRQGQGTYQKGQYIAGESQTVCMEGSLQPTSARALKIAEEGNRLSQYFAFYSDKPLLVTNTRTLADSDRVVINGESYRVIEVLAYQGTGVRLPYYKTTLAREPENA